MPAICNFGLNLFYEHLRKGRSWFFQETRPGLSKKASQSSYIGDLYQNYSNKNIVILPDYGGEVKGEGLVQVARDLYCSAL